MLGRTRAWVVAVVAGMMLLVSGGAGTSTAAADRPIPNEEYFGLVLLLQDEEGVEVPLRNGDETVGFAKACFKHNFCSLPAFTAAIRGGGNKQPPEGPRVVYKAHAVGDGYDFVLRVVVDTSTFSRRGAPPDGRPIGVITAYCEGMVRCPDALNET